MIIKRRGRKATGFEVFTSECPATVEPGRVESEVIYLGGHQNGVYYRVSLTASDVQCIVRCAARQKAWPE